MIRLPTGCGKGGVGKTAMSVAIARKLAKKFGPGKIGILDADINTAKLIDELGKTGEIGFDEKNLIPPEIEGMKVFSMQMLPDEDKAALFSGKQMGEIAEQLFDTVDWTGVEYMVIDLPPGTGEIPQVICKRMQKNDALILVTGTRPPEIKDAIRTLDMAGHYKIRVAGVIVNMAFYNCVCGRQTWRGEPVGIVMGRLNAEQGVHHRERVEVLAVVPDVLPPQNKEDVLESCLNIDRILSAAKPKFSFI